MGGAVMTAAGLLLELQAHGVSLTVEDGQLAMKAKSAPPQALLEAAKAHKAAIIKALKGFDEQSRSSNPAPSGTLETPFDEQKTPQTLEDFLALEHYPKAQGGKLTLVDADGHPITDPAILNAWQPAKGEIQAQLEARHNILTTWAEALLSEHSRVYLCSPDSITCEWETSEGIDDPHHLAGEVLRSEACGLYAQVRTGGERHMLPLWEEARA